MVRRACGFVGPVFIAIGLLTVVCAFWQWNAECPKPRELWVAITQAFSAPLICFVTLLVWLVGILASWWAYHEKSLEGSLRWIGGEDIKPHTEKATDGTSAFIALATFALAEGGALTVVARGEGRTAIVLTIYSVSVAFTAIWIVSLLRMTTTNSAKDVVRAYDDTSVRYGRFALAWTAFVALIMIFLGANQLLPNQTYRAAFPNGPMQTEPPRFVEGAGPQLLTNIVPNGVAAKSWDSLFTWLQAFELNQTKSDPNRLTRLVWLEQKGEFQDYYKSFTAELSYAANEVRVGHRIAMLVRWDRAMNNLVYRQLELAPLPGGGFRDTFKVTDANPHDVLVVVAEIGNKNVSDPVKSDASIYNLGLSVAK